MLDDVHPSVHLRALPSALLHVLRCFCASFSPRHGVVHQCSLLFTILSIILIEKSTFFGCLTTVILDGNQWRLYAQPRERASSTDSQQSSRCRKRALNVFSSRARDLHACRWPHVCPELLRPVGCRMSDVWRGKGRCALAL